MEFLFLQTDSYFWYLALCMLSEGVIYDQGGVELNKTSGIDKYGHCRPLIKGPRN